MSSDHIALEGGREVIEKIEALSREAHGAKGKLAIVDLPTPNAWAIVKPSGDYELHSVPEQLDHRLSEVAEVPRYVEWLTTDFACKPVVWYDTSRVQVTVDTQPPRHEGETIVTIQQTEEWELFVGRVMGKWFDHPAFIRLLRTQLADCVDNADSVIKSLRTIAAAHSQTVKSDQQRTRESLGRELESEILTAAGELPEFIRLKFRVAEDPSLPREYYVPCLLDMQPRDCTFCLTPPPHIMREIRQEHLDAIGAVLDACQCPVFRG